MAPRIAAIGEAMVEFAPVGDGLYRRGFAGDTFNTIWHMRQLLGEGAGCSFVTRIGNDRLSEGFLDLLAVDGIDTSGVTRDPSRTMGLYLIELDGVERSFQYWRSDSAARRLADDSRALAEALSGVRLIYVSGITLAILPPEARETLFGVLAEARERGAQIAFDPNFRARLWESHEEARAVIQKMLTLTDIVLPSYDDERSLWGDEHPEATVQRFLSAGVSEMVVKNSGAGVLISSGAVSAFVDTEAPAKILDTTGAGDSFNAGYLSLRILGVSPEMAVQAGHCLACEVLGHRGARAPKEAVRQIARNFDQQLSGGIM